MRWLQAARNTSGAEECEYSSRKWCSTSQAKSMPRRSASSTCSSASLKQPMLVARAPRARNLMLVEDAELHACPPLVATCWMPARCNRYDFASALRVVPQCGGGRNGQEARRCPVQRPWLAARLPPRVARPCRMGVQRRCRQPGGAPCLPSGRLSRPRTSEPAFVSHRRDTDGRATRQRPAALHDLWQKVQRTPSTLSAPPHVEAPGAALAASTSHGLPTPDVIDSECAEEVMNIVAVEGVVEKGLIRLARPLVLAEGTKVYVIVPESGSRPAAIESPRLAHPEQLAHFQMEVSE